MRRIAQAERTKHDDNPGVVEGGTNEELGGETKLEPIPECTHPSCIQVRQGAS